jgi:CRISPR-associated endonuclease Cas1
VDEQAGRSGVVVVDGYDVVVRVRLGRLEVQDGVGSARRLRRFHRATSGLERLAVVSSSGVISLEALRWLADVRAGLVHLDRRGRLIAAYGPPGTDRPSLRREQARAWGQPTGTELARMLVAAKLDGQLETLETFAPRVDVTGACAGVREQRERLSSASTLEEIRICEAWAAAAYWSALAPLPVMWAHRDEARVPDHWRTVGSRSSPLANGPRLAANPAQAIVNYLAGCLAAEAVLAARIVGLDAGLGVLHVDTAFRDSLAYDLVEVARPKMAQYALQFVTSRHLAVRDFVARRSGQCMLTSPLCSELAETLPRWRDVAGRVAEDFAAALEPRRTNGRASPTPITQRRRAEGRPRGPRVDKHSNRPAASRACSWCGAPIGGASKRSTCSEACESSILARVHAAFVARSSQRMRNYDRTNHPGLTPQANAKRSQTRRAQRAEELAWEQAHPEGFSHEEFVGTILPRLKGYSAGAIAALTGLSVSYCSAILKGERVPHPRWWRRLRDLDEKAPPVTDPPRGT